MVLKPTGYQTGTVVHLNVLHTSLFLFSEKRLGPALIAAAVLHNVYQGVACGFSVAAPAIDAAKLCIQVRYKVGSQFLVHIRCGRNDSWLPVQFGQGVLTHYAVNRQLLRRLKLAHGLICGRAENAVSGDTVSVCNKPFLRVLNIITAHVRACKAKRTHNYHIVILGCGSRLGSGSRLGLWLCFSRRNQGIDRALAQDIVICAPEIAALGYAKASLSTPRVAQNKAALYAVHARLFIVPADNGHSMMAVCRAVHHPSAVMYPDIRQANDTARAGIVPAVPQHGLDFVYAVGTRPLPAFIRLCGFKQALFMIFGIVLSFRHFKVCAVNAAGRYAVTDKAVTRLVYNHARSGMAAPVAISKRCARFYARSGVGCAPKRLHYAPPYIALIVYRHVGYIKLCRVFHVRNYG